MNVEDMKKRLEAAKLLLPRETNKLLGIMAIECQLEIYAINVEMLAELKKISADTKKLK